MIIVAGVANAAAPSPKEAPTTALGLTRESTVFVTMVAVLSAAFVLAGRFRGEHRWRPSARGTLARAVVMLFPMAVHVSTGPLMGTEAAGPLQRVYVAVVVGWPLFVANLLRTVSRQDMI
jgi:hypothetical protein